MPDTTESVSTLLALLRADARPEVWPDTGRLAQIDLDDLAVTAAALGLAPLLHHRMESWGRRLPDARAQAKLDFMRQVETARQLARRAQLAEVLARLPVAPAVLKGMYLAECIYPAPGLRPMNDIDLLFEPADLPAVNSVLAELGYASKDKSPEQGPGITKHTRTFQRRDSAAATPNPYLSSGRTVMIEPHRSLEEAWFGLKCDLTPGVWARLQTVQIAGQPAKILAPADNFLHLCVHLAFHLIMGSPSFVQLADIAVFAQHVPLDWDEFLRRAVERRAAGYALASTSLAVELLAAPIPGNVVKALAAASPASVRAAVKTLSAKDILRRTQRAPLRTISQRLRRGVHDRAETARWAHSLPEWLRVWRSLVEVGRTDTWRMLRQAERGAE